MAEVGVLVVVFRKHGDDRVDRTGITGFPDRRGGAEADMGIFICQHSGEQRIGSFARFSRMLRGLGAQLRIVRSCERMESFLEESSLLGESPHRVDSRELFGFPRYDHLVECRSRVALR